MHVRGTKGMKRLFCRHQPKDLPALFLCILVFSFLCLFRGISAALYPENASGMGIHMELGLKLFQLGHFEKAIVCLKEAGRISRTQGDLKGECLALLHLARSYQSLGAYRESLEPLEKAVSLVKRQEDKTRMAMIFQSMANAYLNLGEQDSGEAFLRKGFAIARDIQSDTVTASILNDMGNIYANQRAYEDAINLYDKALSLIKKADDPLLTAYIFGNKADLFLRKGLFEESRKTLEPAFQTLFETQYSHHSAFGLINIAQTCRSLGTKLPGSAVDLRSLACKALSKAVNISEAINDYPLLSYALGYLGGMYESEARYQEALYFTRRAIFYAQRINASESIYLWEWQMGRLFKATGEMGHAIKAYRRAVEILRSIRHDIDASCEHTHWKDFRKSIEPVYFGLADLLLQYSSSLKEEDMQPYLIEARDTLELMKTAELQDYFEEPCLGEYLSRTQEIDRLSENTAVLYIITLEKRTDLLLSVHGRIKRFSVEVGKDTITNQVRLFRKKLEKRTTREYLRHGQWLYDKLVRPLEAELHSHQIDTLVFIPAGALRTIPMAALHSGEHFLIRRFAIVNTLGLTLTDPRPMKKKRARILLAGISKGIHGFPALEHVSSELHSVHDLCGGKFLLDQNLRFSDIKHELQLNPYSVVHIASHGEFRGDVKESFILAWDCKIDMDQLDDLMGSGRYGKTPLDLLILSACQTAAGDDRAALGLAGVAIKAGARSALATLWNIDDRASSELVVEFYRQLMDTSISKARALQLAQLTLIDDPSYTHPCYWSAFLMIGNWL